MSGTRYVVLGLARPRSPWFVEVGRWATAGAAPLEFVRCVSAEEVRVRLGSGRAFSALLVDGGAAGLDRDLIDVARAAGAATFVVDDGTAARDWAQLQVSGVLLAGFCRGDLMTALEAQAAVIKPVRAVPSDDGGGTDDGLPHGRVIAVLGAGGTGTSLLSMALAQAMSDQATAGAAPPGRGVLLADLALHADQAMLHDAPDIVPGVSELVEAHRAGRPTPDELAASTFAVAGRGYHLLLGLRRHRDWASLRPRATEAMLAGLCRTFETIVADTDADLEGEVDCGSVEVEERNVLARTVTRRADVVFAVGTAELKGIHGLARTIAGCIAAEIDPTRIVAVVNHAPRQPRRRAELTKALTAMLEGAGAGLGASPLHITNHRRVEGILRDGARLPASLGAPLRAAAAAVIEMHLDAAPTSTSTVPVTIRPGTVGRFFPNKAAS